MRYGKYVYTTSKDVQDILNLCKRDGNSEKDTVHQVNEITMLMLKDNVRASFKRALGSNIWNFYAFMSYHKRKYLKRLYGKDIRTFTNPTKAPSKIKKPQFNKSLSGIYYSIEHLNQTNTSSGLNLLKYKI